MIARAHISTCPPHAQTGSVTDAHAIGPGRPGTDECKQDWTLVSADVDGDGLVFVAERALNTGDTQDCVFVDDSANGECFGLYLSTFHGRQRQHHPQTGALLLPPGY